MAITAKVYDKALTALANKEIDWGSDTIKVMILNASYTPDQAAHDYLDDVVAYQVTGTGYTAGGATLTNKTETITSHVKHFDADDVEWANSTITGRTLVVYDDSPATNATKPLICYAQSDADIISTGGPWKAQWHADGIFTATVA